MDRARTMTGRESGPGIRLVPGQSKGRAKPDWDRAKQGTARNDRVVLGHAKRIMARGVTTLKK